jgi:integrase
MLSLAHELGPRAGDVLSLKIRDLNLSHRPATVTFHRRHDDPDDPRRHQPVLKTKPRVLSISNDLAQSLEYWIDKVRSDRTRFPAARRHPYLFTNDRGAPLGQRGYQLVYQHLRESFGELGQLTSHVLRYDWNERWVEMTSAQGGDPLESTREQCYAMGWSDRSSMPAKYARRAVAESTSKKILRMHLAAQERSERSRATRGAA